MMKLVGTIHCNLETDFPTQETINALNNLAGCGNYARFVLRTDTESNSSSSKLCMEFGNATQAHNWCHIISKKAYPGQWGRCMGMNGDTVVEALDIDFRFPNEFFHFVMYMLEGMIFIEDGEWNSSIPSNKGTWEQGYGEETFTSWMQRQIDRLERPEIQDSLKEIPTCSDKRHPKAFKHANWHKRHQVRQRPQVHRQMSKPLKL